MTVLNTKMKTIITTYRDHKWTDILSIVIIIKIMRFFFWRYYSERKRKRERAVVTRVRSVVLKLAMGRPHPCGEAYIYIYIYISNIYCTFLSCPRRSPLNFSTIFEGTRPIAHIQIFIIPNNWGSLLRPCDLDVFKFRTRWIKESNS